MAQAPSPTTSIPMTQPEVPPEVEGEGAERVTVGQRQGWKLPNGVIVFDDGEKVMPVSGLSDQAKRDQALKAALGEVEAPQEAGVPDEAVRELRLGAAQLADTSKINESAQGCRQGDGQAASRQGPGGDRQAAGELAAFCRSVGGGLARRARELVDLEIPRIEELKALGSRPGVLLCRDDVAVPGNALVILHNHLVEAVSCAERGDVTRTAAALAELRRWSITGAA